MSKSRNSSLQFLGLGKLQHLVVNALTVLGNVDSHQLGPVVLSVHIIAEDVPLLVPMLVCRDVDKVEAVRS